MSTLYNPSSERTNYLTLQEAVAEGYGKYSTLRAWIAQGRLPAYKSGRRVKVRRDDLEHLMRPVGASAPGSAPGLDEAVERIVNEAPVLTDEQRDALRSALAGVK